MVKNPPAIAGDTGDAGLIPGSGRSPGEGNVHPLQYSCLKNSMDRGALRATVHGPQGVGHNWAIEHTHIYNQDKEHFYHLWKASFPLLSQPLSPPQLEVSTALLFWFPSPWINFPCLKCLDSLTQHLLRFIYLVEYIGYSLSFILLSDIQLIEGTTIWFSIFLLMKIWGSLVLVPMNKATLNILVWTYVFISLGEIPRSGMAES